MKSSISNTYGADVVIEELSIDIEETGKNYLVIYGWHVNGHFICIPNWGVCCEAAEPTAVEYNVERLERLNCVNYEEARVIATAIKEQAEKQGYKSFETVVSLPYLRAFLLGFNKNKTSESYEEFLNDYAEQGVYVHSEKKLYTYEEIKELSENL